MQNESLLMQIVLKQKLAENMREPLFECRVSTHSFPVGGSWKH